MTYDILQRPDTLCLIEEIYKRKKKKQNNDHTMNEIKSKYKKLEIYGFNKKK